MKNITLEQMVDLVSGKIESGEEVQFSGQVHYFSTQSADSAFLVQQGEFSLLRTYGDKYSIIGENLFRLHFEMDSKRQINSNAKDAVINIPTTLNPESSITLCQLKNMIY